MLILFFLDASKPIVALLKLLADEVNSLAYVLMTVLKSLFHKNWAN